MINLKSLFTVTLFILSGIYYIFLTQDKILAIISGEYIIIAVNIILVIVLLYFKNKLQNLTLISFIPNTDTIALKSTILFFLVFQIVDFYYEDGFIGMISQWFTYWVFGLLAWLLTNNINYYKNYKFYRS
ncbi:MAG: hypothetical protein KAQ94_05570 [Arcobacteraceae bacterium]|nr:hypothetical protein [Arcobacteraceae bacterium]